ncbi:MAG TPA: hypothetical protein VI076_04800, partial [Actinopolymorphaceae bacterium]
MDKHHVLRALAVTTAAALLSTPLAAPATATPPRASAPEDPGQPVDIAGTAIGALNALVQGFFNSDLYTQVSRITGADGQTYKLTNHLRTELVPTTALQSLGLGEELAGTPLAGGDSGGTVPDDGLRREYLVVWSGDRNVLDRSGKQLTHLPDVITPDLLGTGDQIGPDFFAVIDATKGSSTYGKVVNTAVVGPLVENEPHHMQYIWHKGDRIYAGALFLDTTFVFDVSALPELKLTGINLPTDTLCGSVPDAYWVLEDGTAYGTYMGGPDVPGPCVYSDGSVRSGNGFAGSPGEIVRFDENGRTLAEIPAALPVHESEDPKHCVNIPALSLPTCANPHGIQVREDLDRMVVSDYAEPRNIILDPVRPLSPYITRPTVRIFDISDRNRPELVSVSTMPDGPRVEKNPAHEENMAIMETTVTNLPEHKGAFAEAMCGGAIFYTPDITDPTPKWREVFDDTTAARSIDPQVTEGGGCDGGGWVQTSLDDKYLYHAVIGRREGETGPDDTGSAKMLYTLDIEKLLAAGDDVQCSIDTIAEVSN